MSCCGEPRAPVPQQAAIQEKPVFVPQNNGFPQGQQQQQPQAQPPMGVFTPPQGPQQPPQAAMTAQFFGANGSPPPNAMNGEFGQQQQQQQQFTGPGSWNNTPTLNGNSTGNGSYTPLLDPNIIRPNPVHASDAASQHPASIRSSAFSPGPQPLSPQFSGNTMGPANNPMFPPPNNPSYQVNMQQISTLQANQGVTAAAPSDEGRMSVSIDFGTTFSGVSYGSSRIASGTVQQILVWPGASENFRKIPTCLLYDETGRVMAWGLEAKNASPTPGTIRCEWCVWRL
jgi:hypothetical protein